MQLLYLKIPNFRNLRDVEIHFAAQLEPLPGQASETAKPIRSHALIGQNGTGKSNLIEALVTIFRDIDLNRDAAFDYTLEYSIRGHEVKIQADLSKQKRPFVWVDGDKVSQDYLIKNDPADQQSRDERRGPRLLPAHIFAYYSGRNERIEELFREHQRRFIERQEVTTDEVLPERLLENFSASEADIRALEEARKKREARLNRIGDDRLRRLFYCRGGHTQLVLLACFLSDDPVFKKVLADLDIASLESALFVLKEPYRLREKRRSAKFDESEINEGDPRFWFSRGNVVSEFLDKLWQVAWAPIAQEASKQIDFRGRTERQRQLYLFVPSQEKLKRLGELVGGTDSFFRYAEGAYIGDLIEEVRITVRKKNMENGAIEFKQLSEGELQMLTVLGLMRITREDHCLFLLDEPDTHLNPIWKLRYFDDIEKVLKPEQESPAPSTTLPQGVPLPQGKHLPQGEQLPQGMPLPRGQALERESESQVLITTHDPLMVGSLRREQVHILRREGERVRVDEPIEHPRGMGVSGLLKSDLFGLASTLDPRTLESLQRRNELVAKEANKGLSQEEQEELERLRQYLEQLGYSREFRDPMYQLFVQKMYEARSLPLAQLLTPEQLKAQELLAEKIATGLVVQQRAADLEEMATSMVFTRQLPDHTGKLLPYMGLSDRKKSDKLEELKKKLDSSAGEEGYEES